MYALLAMFSLTSATHALTVKSAVKYTAAAALFASIVKYKLTKPNKNRVRYNLEELRSGKSVSENLTYLILDGLIGHAEGKTKLVVDPKDMTVKVDESTKADPKGIYGHIETYYFKPILSALTFLTAMDKTREEISKGVNRWQNI